tara:strand:- start:265 stop:465 length:201 start_codon:yes stop_codon:yes gene_type:complete
MNKMSDKEALRRQRFFIKSLIGLKQSRINNIQQEIEYLETKMESEDICEDLKDAISQTEKIFKLIP